jgi:hypothetical protein
MPFSQFGHVPYRVLSNGIPRACGKSILGGGMAGPKGDLDKERAGDPGEYHHSRNLTKKMAVGSNNLSESRMRCGECTSRRRNPAIVPYPLSRTGLF